MKIPLREDKKPARHEKEDRYDNNGSRLNELVRVSKTVSQPNEHCDVEKLPDALDAKITSDGARALPLCWKVHLRFPQKPIATPTPYKTLAVIFGVAPRYVTIK